MTAASVGLITLTAQIASAHCANNTIEAEALPDLIRQIYQALASVGDSVEAVGREAGAGRPAAPECP